MNTDSIFSLILASVQFITLVCTIHVLRSKQHFLVIVFYAFAVACGFLSTLYWLTYVYLRPDTRMPFAANEICEWAMLLLLASSLHSAFPDGINVKKALLPAMTFAIANTALWIAWSGEWVQDILTGISMGWFMTVVIACLRQAGALARLEWIGLYVLSVALIATQGMTFVVPGNLVSILDVSCTIIMFVVDVWIILKCILAILKRDHSKRGLGLAFAMFAWSVVTMYMSGGVIYFVALMFVAAGCVLMLWAIRKEVREE